MIVADQGRAQALNDLVNFKYRSGEAYYRPEPPEKSTCEVLVAYRASNTVVVAVDERIFSGSFRPVKMFSLELKRSVILVQGKMSQPSLSA